MYSLSHPQTLLVPTVVFVALVATLGDARACPFCVVESQTLTEEIASSDAVVIARLIKEAAPVSGGPDDLGEFGVVDPETGKARFRIEKILLGDELLVGVEEIQAVFFGEPGASERFFIRGVGVKDIEWNIPMPVSDVAVSYIDQLETLPESGPERLAFFLKYLEHEDPLLARDAHDEFARSDYADVIATADRFDRDQLWRWIESRDVVPSRRNLFFTMLGLCGQEEDVERLRKMMLVDQRVLQSAAEASVAMGMGLGGAITLPVVPEMVTMEQRRKQLGFSALVGCYLKLTGEEGLDVIDEHFLANPHADPTRVYGALVALRFLGEETDEVPMGRLLESMRLVLDKPDFAEQAITDLSRWEDWSVLDRLVTMFKEADPKTYVKQPIVAYLDQASHQPGDVGQRATAALEEIEQLDPETVKRARSLLAFGFLGRARAPSGASATDSPAPESTADDAVEDDAAETGRDVLAEELSAEPEPASEEPPLEFSDVPAVAVRTDDAATDEGEPREEPLVEPSTDQVASPAAELPALTDAAAPEAATPLDMRVVFGIPLAFAAGLMALMWFVLRGSM